MMKSEDSMTVARLVRERPDGGTFRKGLIFFNAANKKSADEDLPRQAADNYL
jgi:hypothetical protein